jgi:hypothetical protein
MSLPTLLYRNETLIRMNKNVSTVQIVEIEFLRNIKKCARVDRVINHDMY